MKFSASLPRVLMTLPLLAAFAFLAMKAVPAPLGARAIYPDDEPDTESRIEKMDILPAAKIARGLGFNVDLAQEWEFPRAAEAGATEARMQFDWPSVEKTAGNFALPPKMARALDLCAQNGLEPLIIAAYGPAYRAVTEVTLRTDVPAGSTSLPVSGALSEINPPYCHIMQSDGKQIVAEGKWAYYGALIDSVDAQNGTLQLAAKNSIDLPRGTKLRVNRLLYPSVATPSSNDPSMVAYGRYARFLASEISRRGLRGKVELWNEPPWSHDRWDARGGFYDQVPRDITPVSPNPGMLDQFLNGPTPPSGVSFVWGGSNKSGGRGLGARRGDLTPEQLRNVSADGLHPYGNAPESHAWDPAQMRANSAFQELALPGTNLSSNMKILRQNQLRAQNRGALFPAIVATEVGEFGADENARTRANLRIFLTYLSLGFERINFFKLADKSSGYAFMDRETQKPYRPFLAFKALMQKMNNIKEAPTPFNESDLPVLTSYRGAWPLLTIPIVGRPRGAVQNSILFIAYQRTFPSGKAKWKDLPSPEASPLTVRIPPRMRVMRVWNLVSGTDVAFTTKNQSVSYSVSDDPTAVELAPLA